MDKTLAEAFAAAKTARDHAHAPYSHFKVGAAFILDNGEIVAGCNVENASYGATICAERTALTAAVARFGKIRPEALVLVIEPEAYPCGLCLQVMAEFCGPKFPIHIATPQGIRKQVSFDALFPQPFRADKLK